jgi:hypothetical protein
LNVNDPIPTLAPDRSGLYGPIGCGHDAGIG